MSKVTGCFLFIIVIGVFSNASATEIEPSTISSDSQFICDSTNSYVQRQIKEIESYKSDIAPTVVSWVSNSTEVVSVVHSSMCGNLGCSALVSFKKDGDSCISKSIAMVQPHISLYLDLNVVNVPNITGCVSWLLHNGKVSKSSCE